MWYLLWLISNHSKDRYIYTKKDIKLKWFEGCVNRETTCIKTVRLTRLTTIKINSCFSRKRKKDKITSSFILWLIQLTKINFTKGFIYKQRIRYMRRKAQFQVSCLGEFISFPDIFTTFCYFYHENVYYAAQETFSMNEALNCFSGFLLKKHFLRRFPLFPPIEWSDLNKIW